MPGYHPECHIPSWELQIGVASRNSIRETGPERLGEWGEPLTQHLGEICA